MILSVAALANSFIFSRSALMYQSIYLRVSAKSSTSPGGKWQADFNEI